MTGMKQGFEIIGAVPQRVKNPRVVAKAFAPAHKELKALLEWAASRRRDQK